METIRIRKQIDSETITLPELRPFLGKTVDILVFPESKPAVMPGTGDWKALADAAANLDGYDFEAWQRQRELDQEHAPDLLP